MENNELNEKIAILRGWRKATNHRIESWRDYWYDPKDPNQTDDGDVCATKVPDYTGSWNSAGELLEDLYNPKIGLPSLTYQSGVDESDFSKLVWVCEERLFADETIKRNNQYLIRFSDNPKRAISETWYELNKDKTE